ncbi:MAG: T9SS C-terminal target domain-containing protein [Bacteroidetes bacterium]|nr:MAG: T9SS C-terminal target domain-containing protein [Bacteroidota bacterium]
MNTGIQALWLLWVGLLLAPHLQAQYSWTPHGPDNLGSKTRALAFTAEGKLLAGSEGGGLWVSENEGVSWQRLATYQGNPNITSISVEGNHIYVGTGASQLVSSPYEALFPAGFDLSTTPEGFLGYTGLPGAGVYVSEDNGASWSNANGTTDAFWGTLNYQGPFIAIQKVLSANGRVFIATRRGLFYSDDSDLKQVVPALGSQRFMNGPVYDIEIAAGGRVFAGTADSLYVSEDGGQTFRDLKDPGLYSLGRLSFQRVAIAVAPSDAAVVYVAGTRSNGELSGIWQSKDGGQSWRNFAPSGNPGFTPLGTSGRDAFVLEVFPTDAERVVVAGANWYTFSREKGWVQTAQRFNPAASDYVPAPVYCLSFHPQKPGSLFVGTGFQIVRSTDGGQTFTQKNKGYEAALTVSVASLAVAGRQAIVSGTPGRGVILNGHFRSGLPVAQAFGDINPVTYSRVAASSLYPGALLIQGPDEGLLRSPAFGTAFETFYGLPISPQVRGLLLQDTLIDRQDNFLSDSDPTVNVLRDDNGPLMMPWVLDEVIPEEMVGEHVGREELQQLENFVFFCSRSYLWRVSYPLGSPGGLLPRWNRLTNRLVQGSEFFTAIAVSGDTAHTVYVGTSRGRLFRIERPHDLERFDVSTHVQPIHANLPPGRWISSIAVDPLQTDRLLVTLAGYGGNVQGETAFVWYQDASTSGFFFPLGGNIPREPTYSSRFVEDPRRGRSVLLLGTETGLFSLRDFPESEVATPEFGEEVGSVPVYDIHVQRYLAHIRDEETQDFYLSKDNSLFVATHGHGVWSSTSLAYERRAGEEPGLSAGPEVLLYPNPGGKETHLYVSLAEDARLQARVYDLQGRMLGSMAVAYLPKGQHDLLLFEQRLQAGLYLIRVDIEGSTEKLVRMFKFLAQ